MSWEDQPQVARVIALAFWRGVCAQMAIDREARALAALWDPNLTYPERACTRHLNVAHDLRRWASEAT